MRTKSTGGFTLIELLIVIAIIGILAAVLIPNLLNARNSANDRAAEAYGRNVYTAAVATLASDPGITASSVADSDCAAGYSPAVVVSAGYAVGDPGAAVASCEVSANNNDIVVEVESVNGTDFTFP